MLLQGKWEDTFHLLYDLYVTFTEGVGEKVDKVIQSHNGYRVSVHSMASLNLLNPLIQPGRVPVKRGEQLAAVAEAHAAALLWNGFILTLWQVPTAESPRQPGPQSGAQAAQADVAKTCKDRTSEHSCSSALIPAPQL